MHFSVPSEEGRGRHDTARADMRSYSVTERCSKADFRVSYICLCRLC